jgi:hypothetical protein
MSLRRSAPALGLLALLGLLLSQRGFAAAPERADLALVLAMDVSESMDEARFNLQMEGVAQALGDAEVEASILSGPHRSIMISLVQWSNRPVVSLPWTLLTSAADVRQFAGRVRRLERAGHDFTCMSTALRSIADKLVTQLPAPADRIVIDVSGDGHDNCNPRQPVDQVRDELADRGISINGLPILEGDEAFTLEAWYREHVIGGPDAFLMPASGFADFERAMRRKFVSEISAAPCSGCVRAASR